MKFLCSIAVWTLLLTLVVKTTSCSPDCSQCFGPKDTSVQIYNDVFSKLYHFRIVMQTEHGLLDCNNSLPDGQATAYIECPLPGKASPVRISNTSNALNISADYWIQELEGELFDKEGKSIFGFRVYPKPLVISVPPQGAPSCVEACPTAFFSGKY